VGWRLAEGGRVVIVTEFSALPDSYRMVGVKLGIVMAGGLTVLSDIVKLTGADWWGSDRSSC